MLFTTVFSQPNSKPRPLGWCSKLWRSAAFNLMLILALLVAAQSAVFANQESSDETDDMSDLSLEELMDLDVVLLNVLGTHTHYKGEWMVNYSYMTMGMGGNRNGKQQLSTADVLDTYMVSPTKMRMSMHMSMLMYAPSDDLTLMAMVHYIKNSMDHVTRSGVGFTTKADGIGDTKVGLIYTFLRPKSYRQRLLFSGHISLPTGSINEMDFLANPVMGKQKLPYPMQLGSGTIDLRNALTYLGEAEEWGWGTEIGTTFRFGRNDNGYRLGNRYRFSAWADWKWADWVGPSFYISGEKWNNIVGADLNLDPAMVPTADPTLRGGETIDLSAGLTFYLQQGPFKGQRFVVKGTVPLYRSLKGPQLETDWQITAGWQWTY